MASPGKHPDPKQAAHISKGSSRSTLCICPGSHSFSCWGPGNPEHRAPACAPHVCCWVLCTWNSSCWGAESPRCCAGGRAFARAHTTMHSLLLSKSSSLPANSAKVPGRESNYLEVGGEHKLQRGNLTRRREDSAEQRSREQRPIDTPG